MPCLRLAGITGLTINGTAMMVVSDVTYSPNQMKRETLPGLDGIHGYSEVKQQGFIEATLRDAGDLSLQDLNGQTCVEVQVQLANGKVIGGSNMWCVTAIEGRAAEGTFQVRFDGDTVTETFA